MTESTRLHSHASVDYKKKKKGAIQYFKSEECDLNSKENNQYFGKSIHKGKLKKRKRHLCAYEFNLCGD